MSSSSNYDEYFDALNARITRRVWRRYENLCQVHASCSPSCTFVPEAHRQRTDACWTSYFSQVSRGLCDLDEPGDTHCFDRAVLLERSWCERGQLYTDFLINRFRFFTRPYGSEL